jgi:hypothetical protein
MNAARNLINYNALESTLRYRNTGSQFLLSYACAKPIGPGSNIGERLDPINPGQSRIIRCRD